MTEAQARFRMVLAQIAANTAINTALINKIMAAAELRRRQIAWLEGTEPADPSRPNGGLHR
jgi:hypothetical protein